MTHVIQGVDMGFHLPEGQLIIHSEDCQGCKDGESIDTLPTELLIPTIHLPIIFHPDHAVCGSCGALAIFDEGIWDTWTTSDGVLLMPLCGRND